MHRRRLSSHAALKSRTRLVEPSHPVLRPLLASAASTARGRPHIFSCPLAIVEQLYSLIPSHLNSSCNLHSDERISHRAHVTRRPNAPVASTNKAINRYRYLLLIFFGRAPRPSEFRIRTECIASHVGSLSRSQASPYPNESKARPSRHSSRYKYTRYSPPCVLHLTDLS